MYYALWAEWEKVGPTTYRLVRVTPPGWGVWTKRGRHIDIGDTVTFRDGEVEMRRVTFRRKRRRIKRRP